MISEKQTNKQPFRKQIKLNQAGEIKSVCLKGTSVQLALSYENQAKFLIINLIFIIPDKVTKFGLPIIEWLVHCPRLLESILSYAQGTFLLTVVYLQ